MGSLDIRRLTPDDAEAYKRLRIEAAADPAFGATPEVEQALPVAALRQVLVASGDGFVLGAFDHDRIVGMIGFGAGIDEAQGTLFGLFVSQRMRTQGIGRKLVRAFIEHLPRSTLRIELFVDAGNAAAISLYRNEGFSRVQEARAVVTMALEI